MDTTKVILLQVKGGQGNRNAGNKTVMPRHAAEKFFNRDPEKYRIVTDEKIVPVGDLLEMNTNPVPTWYPESEAKLLVLNNPKRYFIQTAEGIKAMEESEKFDFDKPVKGKKKETVKEVKEKGSIDNEYDIKRTPENGGTVTLTKKPIGDGTVERGFIDWVNDKGDDQIEVEEVAEKKPAPKKPRKKRAPRKTTKKK